MPDTTRVLADANVLFSKTLRDWLALLSQSENGEIYQVYWSEDILAEVLYRLRRKHPSWDGAQTRDVRDKIVGTFEGGCVDDFIVDGSFQGSDANDAHVHAAARACKADILLTCDGGFTGVGVDPDSLPYEVYLPDDFFVLVHDGSPDRVAAVTREQTEYWVKKKRRAPLAEFLVKSGCPQFAEIVRSHQTELSLSPPQGNVRP